MADLAKITTNTQRTWQSENSDSSTSSTASGRYKLDEEDDTPVLVYEMGQHFSTKSQKDLCTLIDDDPHYQRKRVTKKPLPRFTGTVEVKQHDLYTLDERKEFRKYPNYDSFLAQVNLPMQYMLGRMLLGSYQDIYIISPETSPDGSLSGADESRKISPSSTFSSIHDDEASAQHD